jgi:hypothetical protein
MNQQSGAKALMKRAAKPLLSAALLAAGAGSLLSAGSAQAGVFTWGELFPALGEVGACNGATLDPRCTEGDKTISNLVTDFTSLAPNLTTLSFINTGAIWDVNVLFNIPVVAGPYAISYDLAIAGSKVFNDIGLDSSCNRAAVGPCTVTKDVRVYDSLGVLSPLPSLTLESIDGVPDAPVPLGPNAKKIRVTDIWSSGTDPDTGDPASIDAISNNFTQRETVPGPLPLLGAGAAFGFSRKLRSRIKGSAKA